MARAAKPVGMRGTDEESLTIIYEGATAAQLATMFRQDLKVVIRKVSGLVPVSKRNGTNVYSIAEAAARLVKPSYEIERYIMEMNHLDLPPLLSKEFWNGQRSRLNFEEANGDSWRTADVVRAISVLFNATRMVLLLLPDTVEREAGLTREQKSVVRRVIDGALVDGREKLVKVFENYGMGSHYRDAGVGSGPLPVPDLGRANSEDRGGTGVLAAAQDADQYNGL